MTKKANPMTDKYRKALKNYTSDISGSRTFSEIQQILIDFGARGIGTELDDQGRIDVIHFKIILNDKEQFIKVPLRTENVIEVLKRQRKFRSEEHAYRVALRNIKDLLDAQMAFLATEMVKFEELMLPFFTNAKGETLFEIIEKNQFAIPEKT